MSERPPYRWGVTDEDPRPLYGPGPFDIALAGELQMLVERITPEDARERYSL